MKCIYFQNNASGGCYFIACGNDAFNINDKTMYRTKEALLAEYIQQAQKYSYFTVNSFDRENCIEIEEFDHVQELICKYPEYTI